MTFNVKEFLQLSGKDVYEILKSRQKVFAFEQNIHYLDMDDIDYDSLHCFFEKNGTVTAYLRAYEKDGCVRIGRVLTLEHGKGDGKRLVEMSVNAIKDYFGCEKICLDAQTQAKGFYEKLGFVAVSEEFIEAGVPHVAMEKYV